MTPATVPSTSSLPNLFPLPDGCALYVHQWAQINPVGSLLLLHGKGDYGARFHELGSRLQQEGWNSYAPDQRGFGRSPGLRGKTWRFRNYLQDLAAVQARIQAQDCLGYSAGANLAVEYALAHPQDIRGLVLVSPAFCIDQYFNPVSLRLLQLLDRIAPQLVLSRRYTPAKVTSLLDEQVTMHFDPWITGISRVRFVAELWRSGRRCVQQADQLQMPILILYSSKDRVVTGAGAVEFYQAVQQGSADVTMVECHQSEHDLLHDRDAATAMQTIATWLKQVVLDRIPS